MFLAHSEFNIHHVKVCTFKLPKICDQLEPQQTKNLSADMNEQVVVSQLTQLLDELQ